MHTHKEMLGTLIQCTLLIYSNPGGCHHNDKDMSQGHGAELNIKLNPETRHRLGNTKSGQLIM